MRSRPLTLGSIALLLLAALVAWRLEVTTEITHFLPDGKSDVEVDLARQLAAGELSRTMVLVVDAPDEATVLTASRDFEAALRAEPRVADALGFLEGGPADGVEEALWRLYHPRRLAFAAARADAVSELLTEDALEDGVALLKRRLATPMSSMLSRVAPGDPLLFLPRLFEELAGGRAESLRVAEDRFLTEDGGAVLFLGTEAPSFDSTVQGPLLAGVRAAFEEVDAAHGGVLSLSQSGANRFAVAAESAIRADIQRVSVGSVVGLTLLFAILFRSLRLVLMTLPVLTAGFLTGTAVCVLVFGQVHGLTLAFGAALIGVSIDYTVHFQCHHLLAPHRDGPQRTLAGIWKGLALGAATTVVGFVALLVSTFPGLRELAVFAACGITAALLATRVFPPHLVPQRSEPTALARGLAAALTRGAGGSGPRRLAAAVPSVAVLALVAAGIPALTWNDDIADMNQLDPALMAEDEGVRARVVRYEQRRLVVAMGADEQAALEANDAVAEVLAAAEANGEIGTSRNVASLVPSASRQRAVDAAMRGDADLWPRMEKALAAQGFVAASFDPFREVLEGEPPAPLQWSDVLATPLASMVRPFRVTLDSGVGIVSFLHDVRDADALAQRFERIEGARMVDIAAVLTRAYAAYRERMTSLLLLGLLAIVGLVALRHRALGATVAACAPAFLGAAGTLAILALAGVEMNVLSLVALLMIVSMGVDYGVFLGETRGERRELDATHLALFVAGMSTILGFGLLALSSHPALFSIGITSGVGVTLCLILAPTLRAFLQPVGTNP